tara:strand:- start:10366 stop:11139 length:774 start_codon:yes stop_codon:yes gene_type:complete
MSFGSGKETLLCFHGFGKEAKDFLPFEKKLGNKFTIHSIHLFYHGNSIFPDYRLERKPLKKSELKSLIEQIQKNEGFSKFSLAGYSLGGKVALIVAEQFRTDTENLFLLAPDGIGSNPWYYFASQTYIGQRVNQANVKNQWVFDFLFSISKNLRLASKKQMRFARSKMQSEKQRRRVYQIWMSHRKLKSPLKVLIKDFNQRKLPVYFFIGKHEIIIPLNPIEKFVGQLKYGKLFLMDSGHTLDTEEIGKLISTELEY